MDDKLAQALRDNAILADNLAWCAEVIAATAEDLLTRKATGKYERERQRSIIAKTIRALRGERVGRPNAAWQNAVMRLERVAALPDTASSTCRAA